MSTTTGVINDGQITASDDGGNSAVLSCATGDFTLSGVFPNGKAAVTADTRSSFCGLRQGERVPITGSFSVFASDPEDTFAAIADGTVAGFTSTTAAVGDLVCVDLEIDNTYSGETRKLLLDDCHLTRDFAEGNPSTFTYNFTCYGRYRVQNGTATTTIVSGL